MVHRDVKPGNILVRPDGSVKITDFGIAWSARSVALTRTGQVIGTPQYLSPEQAEGRPATPASDVYALGLIGYECLTGKKAFEGDNAVTIALKQVRQDPEPLPDELPAEVRTLIGRALAKNPAVRFSNGAAFVAAIDDVRAGRPLPEAPPTVDVGGRRRPRPGTRDGQHRTGHPASGERRRNRAAMVLLPLLGLLAGAGIAVALLLALADDSAGSPAVAAEQREAGSIVLDAGEFVGRPVDEVVRRLTRLGLDVEPRAEPRNDVVPDQVTAIEPDGEPLEAGDTVVVTYAAPDTTQVDAPAPRPAVTGSAGGAGTPVEEEEQQAPVEEPAPEPTAPSTSAPPPPLPGTSASSAPPPSTTTSESTVTESSTPATTSATPPAEASTNTAG